ncbi:DUF5979 domain-containing protein [Parasporobacterium paucivorans]|uniref:LPXTG-motif cell wall anchor domain-containing protein n=1 Tax=Parasporobacterium paucivorans DSM 15970 TaxID=1122934 RepID=A0A1M6KAV4_9FIRM|nr:DUF5979 domain-containing protein [Parasporobacterium paucivorans]SHJ56088.1 LPXTG-motif cell wall anchor domain-containing protein [Parasporobacterium paucivorans DSM 15970]
MTWDNLIPGEYTVTEASPGANWTVLIPNDGKFTVTAGEDTIVDVTVTNSYSVGSLTVNKIVNTNNAIGLTVPSFNITITGPSYPTGNTKIFSATGGAMTWDNLIPGVYTVTEAALSDPLWRTNIAGSPFTVVAGENTTVDVTVTNIYFPNLPMTGDSNNIALLILGLGAGLFGIGLASKKRKAMNK